GNGGNGIEANSASSNQMIGNDIGTNSTGADLHNGGRGISISQGDNNLIGGSPPGEGNILRISSSGGLGVCSGGENFGENFRIFAGIRLDFRRSSSQQAVTTSGAEALIDLGCDGRTPNDPPPDADTGANNLVNFPVIQSVTVGNFNVGI